MSLLCLDVGSKRIGVAKSDELGIAAHPLAVIERRGSARDLAYIVGLCREHEIACVVVGLPLDQENRIGPAAQKILVFVEKLKSAFEAAGMDMPIETWDERYSTVEAEEHLIGADVSRAKRRRVVDKMAATMILRSYMENKS